MTLLMIRKSNILKYYINGEWMGKSFLRQMEMNDETISSPRIVLVKWVKCLRDVLWRSECEVGEIVARGRLNDGKWGHNREWNRCTMTYNNPFTLEEATSPNTDSVDCKVLWFLPNDLLFQSIFCIQTGRQKVQEFQVVYYCTERSELKMLKCL